MNELRKIIIDTVKYFELNYDPRSFDNRSRYDTIADEICSRFASVSQDPETEPEGMESHLDLSAEDISTEFSIGEIVYLKTDMIKVPRMVTRIMIDPGMGVSYCLSTGMVDSWHYEIEIAHKRTL